MASGRKKTHRWLDRRYKRKVRNPVAEELRRDGPRERSIRDKRREEKEKEAKKEMKEYL